MVDAAAGGGSVLTIGAARDHLKVSSSADPAVGSLIPAAQGRIENFLGRELVGPTGWPAVGAVPPIVVHCVKLALSDFYLNRETPELTDEQLRPIIGRYQAISIA